ncbi:MAG: diguanylate cyclase [Bacillota bacterium]|nr:diguanylate cyclase [Bacillota bacterium]
MAKQLIVFCDNYRRELESLNLVERFNDVEIAYFPSRCGMPPIEWPKLKKSLPQVGNYSNLHVVSCSGIAGLPAVHNLNGYCHRSDFQNCHHMIINPELVEYYLQKGFYLITPGWLGHWRNTLAGWGFNQAAAASFFKDTIRAVLLLDTGVDPAAEANLVEFARYVERPFEKIKVGLDYLELVLTNAILKSKVESGFGTEEALLTDRQKEFADFAMVLDLLNTLARVREEELVIEKIREMFTMLFAPREVNYRPAVEENVPDKPGKNIDSGGFTLPIQGSSDLLGYLDIIEVDQPRHLDQYKKLANRIVNICGLAIENARHYQTIKELSDTDGLTGLANRRKLDEHLAQEWRRMLREKKPLTVMMCDIDYFKNYNDLYGHQAGDDCLRAVAAVLANHCRRSGDLATRYGGEEFALVMPAVDLERAGRLAETIRKNIEALKLRHEGSSVDDFVTLSIGVACRVPSAESAPEKLLVAADKALYAAKEDGRNRVCST